ncbi:uncharacterized protein V1518DRAFT_200940 [Limtongia smithiae]|uniref:uncharacterized protein n=1 Tax=Limtongia smithiae TaxID=1125753 RepID=UPI0034CE202E
MPLQRTSIAIPGNTRKLVVHRDICRTTSPAMDSTARPTTSTYKCNSSDSDSDFAPHERRHSSSSDDDSNKENIPPSLDASLHAVPPQPFLPGFATSPAVDTPHKVYTSPHLSIAQRMPLQQLFLSSPLTPDNAFSEYYIEHTSLVSPDPEEVDSPITRRQPQHHTPPASPRRRVLSRRAGTHTTASTRTAEAPSRFHEPPPPARKPFSLKPQQSLGWGSEAVLTQLAVAAAKPTASTKQPLQQQQQQQQQQRPPRRRTARATTDENAPPSALRAASSKSLKPSTSTGTRRALGTKPNMLLMR